MGTTRKTLIKEPFLSAGRFPPASKVEQSMLHNVQEPPAPHLICQKEVQIVFQHCIGEYVDPTLVLLDGLNDVAPERPVDDGVSEGSWITGYGYGHPARILSDVVLTRSYRDS